MKGSSQAKPVFQTSSAPRTSQGIIWTPSASGCVRRCSSLRRRASRKVRRPQKRRLKGDRSSPPAKIKETTPQTAAKRAPHSGSREGCLEREKYAAGSTRRSLARSARLMTRQFAPKRETYPTTRGTKLIVRLFIPAPSRIPEVKHTAIVSSLKGTTSRKRE